MTDNNRTRVESALIDRNAPSAEALAKLSISEIASDVDKVLRMGAGLSDISAFTAVLDRSRPSLHVPHETLARRGALLYVYLDLPDNGKAITKTATIRVHDAMVFDESVSVQVHAAHLGAVPGSHATLPITYAVVPDLPFNRTHAVSANLLREQARRARLRARVWLEVSPDAMQMMGWTRAMARQLSDCLEARASYLEQMADHMDLQEEGVHVGDASMDPQGQSEVIG